MTDVKPLLRTDTGRARERRSNLVHCLALVEYGPDFAPGVRGDARLDKVRERVGGESLSKLVKDGHHRGSKG